MKTLRATTAAIGAILLLTGIVLYGTELISWKLAVILLAGGIALNLLTRNRPTPGTFDGY